MRPDAITLAIREKLSPEELRETADKMVEAMTKRDQIESDKKTADSGFNAEIKKLDEEVNELAKRYHAGHEVAQIGCDIRYNDPEVGKKTYYRMDKNEAVETHDMTWEEKQEDIQMTLPDPPADEPAAPEGEIEPDPAEVDAALESTRHATLANGRSVAAVCDHPQVSSNNEGVWTCDKCGEVLTDAPPVDLRVGEQPPQAEPEQPANPPESVRPSFAERMLNRLKGKGTAAGEGEVPHGD